MIIIEFIVSYDNLLSVAAVDITALIQGAGEAWITKLKKGTVAE